MSVLGEIIRETRVKRRLSLQDVAIGAGITKTHIWDMETGRAQNPTIETILKLAVSLDINPHRLVKASLFDVGYRK
jgi:transcriptional regulator with XRE-family HTH domain